MPGSQQCSSVVAAVVGRGVWHALEAPVVPAVPKQTATVPKFLLPLARVAKQRLVLRTWTFYFTLLSLLHSVASLWPNTSEVPKVQSSGFTPLMKLNTLDMIPHTPRPSSCSLVLLESTFEFCRVVCFFVFFLIYTESFVNTMRMCVFMMLGNIRVRLN